MLFQYIISAFTHFCYLKIYISIRREMYMNEIELYTLVQKSIDHEIKIRQNDPILFCEVAENENITFKIVKNTRSNRKYLSELPYYYQAHNWHLGPHIPCLLLNIQKIQTNTKRNIQKSGDIETEYLNKYIYTLHNKQTVRCLYCHKQTPYPYSKGKQYVHGEIYFCANCTAIYFVSIFSGAGTQFEEIHKMYYSNVKKIDIKVEVRFDVYAIPSDGILERLDLFWIKIK